MSYHKKNLEEKLVEVAWNICVAESWEKVNMREVAKKARVSNTAFYRHLKNKNDLKAELVRRGFEIINKGKKNLANNFSGYGAHYIRFGLKYPYIYDLIFGNTDYAMIPDVKKIDHVMKDIEQYLIDFTNS